MGTTTSNVSKYDEKSLDPTKNYEYYVVAVNGSLTSAFSNTSTSFPLAIGKEYGFDQGVSLFPNPSQGNRYISCNESATSIIIRSLEGTVLQKNMHASEIDGTQLNPGMYVITAEFKTVQA